MTAKRILTLSGSIRTGSFNQKLQAVVDEKLRAAGFEVTSINLGDYPLPIFNDDDDVPDNAKHLADLFRTHDAIFVATPEYNGSLPPLLVNCITWLSTQRPSIFRDRVWGIGGVSSGKYGTISALSHLRDSISKMGAVIAPGLLGLGPSKEIFDEHGNLTDEPSLKKVDQLIASFQSISLQ